MRLSNSPSRIRKLVRMPRQRVTAPKTSMELDRAGRVPTNPHRNSRCVSSCYTTQVGTAERQSGAEQHPCETRDTCAVTENIMPKAEEGDPPQYVPQADSWQLPCQIPDIIPHLEKAKAYLNAINTKWVTYLLCIAALHFAAWTGLTFPVCLFAVVSVCESKPHSLPSARRRLQVAMALAPLQLLSIPTGSFAAALAHDRAKKTGIIMLALNWLLRLAVSGKPFMITVFLSMGVTELGATLLGIGGVCLVAYIDKYVRHAFCINAMGFDTRCAECVGPLDPIVHKGIKVDICGKKFCHEHDFYCLNTCPNHKAPPMLFRTWAHSTGPKEEYVLSRYRAKATHNIQRELERNCCYFVQSEMDLQLLTALAYTRGEVVYASSQDAAMYCDGPTTVVDAVGMEAYKQARKTFPGMSIFAEPVFSPHGSSYYAIGESNFLTRDLPKGCRLCPGDHSFLNMTYPKCMEGKQAFTLPRPYVTFVKKDGTFAGAFEDHPRGLPADLWGCLKQNGLEEQLLEAGYFGQYSLGRDQRSVQNQGLAWSRTVTLILCAAVAIAAFLPIPKATFDATFGVMGFLTGAATAYNLPFVGCYFGHASEVSVNTFLVLVLARVNRFPFPLVSYLFSSAVAVMSLAYAPLLLVHAAVCIILAATSPMLGLSFLLTVLHLGFPIIPVLMACCFSFTTAGAMLLSGLPFSRVATMPLYITPKLAEQILDSTKVDYPTLHSLAIQDTRTGELARALIRVLTTRQPERYAGTIFHAQSRSLTGKVSKRAVKVRTTGETTIQGCGYILEATSGLATVLTATHVAPSEYCEVSICGSWVRAQLVKREGEVTTLHCSCSVDIPRKATCERKPETVKYKSPNGTFKLDSTKSGVLLGATRAGDSGSGITQNGKLVGIHQGLAGVAVVASDLHGNFKPSISDASRFHLTADDLPDSWKGDLPAPKAPWHSLRTCSQHALDEMADIRGCVEEQKLLLPFVSMCFATGLVSSLSQVFPVTARVAVSCLFRALRMSGSVEIAFALPTVFSIGVIRSLQDATRVIVATCIATAMNGFFTPSVVIGTGFNFWLDLCLMLTAFLVDIFIHAGYAPMVDPWIAFFGNARWHMPVGNRLVTLNHPVQGCKLELQKEQTFDPIPAAVCVQTHDVAKPVAFPCVVPMRQQCFLDQPKVESGTVVKYDTCPYGCGQCKGEWRIVASSRTVEWQPVVLKDGCYVPDDTRCARFLRHPSDRKDKGACGVEPCEDMWFQSSNLAAEIAKVLSEEHVRPTNQGFIKLLCRLAMGCGEVATVPPCYCSQSTPEQLEAAIRKANNILAGCRPDMKLQTLAQALRRHLHSQGCECDYVWAETEEELSRLAVRPILRCSRVGTLFVAEMEPEVELQANDGAKICLTKGGDCWCVSMNGRVFVSNNPFEGSQPITLGGRTVHCLLCNGMLYPVVARYVQRLIGAGQLN